MPADAGDDGEDPVIRAERAHLITSREYLRQMRQNVLAINPMAGDRVSLQYLMADLYRRAESLKDLPDAPLFFGRLDYGDLAGDTEFAGATGRGAPGARGDGGREPPMRGLRPPGASSCRSAGLTGRSLRRSLATWAGRLRPASTSSSLAAMSA